MHDTKPDASFGLFHFFSQYIFVELGATIFSAYSIGEETGAQS